MRISTAVFYHNLAPLVQPIAQQIAAQNLPQGPQQAVKAMAAEMSPDVILAYAYAQGDSITFAANTEGGPFGLGQGYSSRLTNALQMQSIIQHGMGTSK